MTITYLAEAGFRNVFTATIRLAFDSRKPDLFAIP